MKNRVNIKNLVSDQLPSFVKESYPEFVDFLKKYYESLESPGSPADILNNIDQYTKLENISELVYYTELNLDLDYGSSDIIVDSTYGFPPNNGLLKIDDELILYETKNENSFLNCIRGFSGISTYNTNPISVETSLIDTHTSGSIVYNIHSLFLAEIYKKFKRQYAPGFDDIEFYNEINEKVLVSNLKQFYASKGSYASFEVLFKSLWGSNVQIIKPRDFLIQPSDADYRVTRDLVVKVLSGNPLDIINRTLFQNSDDGNKDAQSSITNVERIIRGDDEYYRLSLDYNPELEISKFKVHPKTRVTNLAGIGQTYLDVDSTLSFNNSGTIVLFDNGVEYQINYTSKNITQFFGLICPFNVKLNQDVTTPEYAFSITDSGDLIKVKITGVLEDLKYDKSSSYYYEEGDQIQIISLGENEKNTIRDNWIFNLSPEYEIKTISQVALKLNGAAQYRITTYDPNIFTLGDVATLKQNNGSEYSVFAISILNKYIFDINVPVQLDITNSKFSIRRGISKANCNNLEISHISSDILNVYCDNQDTYVVSTSLPNYFNLPIVFKDLSVTFSGTYDGYDINIGSNSFIGGESVYYTRNNNIGLNIDDGQYFIDKVNADTIRLSTSKSNIANEDYIYVFGTPIDNKIYLTKFFEKKLDGENLIKKFSSSTEDDIIDNRITLPGTTGLFLNGVELINYKSTDAIYSGPIQEIVVSSVGDSNYDVINPPIMIIEDIIGVENSPYGYGAEAICNVVGSLSKIIILDKGFDYYTEPKITISGGNGSGAEARANLSKVIHTVPFNAGSLYDQVNLSSSTIGFSTYHKFRNFEQVIYNSQNQLNIGNLVDKSTYFVRTVSTTEVKLHNTLNDAILGISTINFSSYGGGLQNLSSYTKKNVISSIQVINPGKNYTNKTLFFDENSINIFNNTITIKNHGYSDKEIILFGTDGTLPTGISTNSQYFVKIIDKNIFKISAFIAVGIGSTVTSDFNYENKKFIEFNDKGIGQHFSKYQPISVKLESPIGITTFSGQDFTAKFEPMFLGRIESVSLKNKGLNYGNTKIVNYNRQPNITLLSGKDAQLKPIVSLEGKIIGVIVNNPGSDYNSLPILEVFGSGFGAILVPIIKNKKIVEIKVIDTGFGYNQLDTYIKVTSNGSNAKFLCKIKEWNINLFEKLFQSNNIPQDDGILRESLTGNNLQYTNAYASRELRKKLLATSIDRFGNTIYRPDLENENNSVKYHSPIVGWAYDGNPIYGPYGYKNKEGGSIVRLNTGYKFELKQYRPSTEFFPPGYFVEDYEFANIGDLDEHNGRYCKTPEFPNGVYAYFTTVNTQKDSSGPFNGFLKPVFPYTIGSLFKSKIINFNYNNSNNIDLNTIGWSRFTAPLNLNFSKTRYDGVITPDLFSGSFTEVTNVDPGDLVKMQIISPGDNYSTLDTIFFDSSNSGGYGAYGTISELKGRPVSTLQYLTDTFPNSQFVLYGSGGSYIGFSSLPHYIVTGSKVSITNVNILSDDFAGSYSVGITTNILTVSTSIGSTIQTGIVTYLNVIGNLNFPEILENDVYRIGSENFKILNAFPKDSRIRVYRDFNTASIGSTQDTSVASAHTFGSQLKELTRKFNFNSGFSTSFNYNLNREYYFDPKESAIISSENLILYSTPVSPNLVASAWNYYTLGIGTGTIDYFNHPSPDGSNNATKVSFASTTGSSDAFGIKYESISLSSDYNTFSIFLKGNTNNEKIYMILDDGSSYYSQLVTLGEDWKRYSLTAQTGAGVHRIRIGTFGTQGYTLNSSPTFYVWGAQVELGKLTSSYYSTSGIALSRASNKSGLLFFSNPGKSQLKGIETIVNTFYIPEHNFKTGDNIVYSVGYAHTGISISYGSTTINLSDSQELYAAVYDKNFIGLSTQKVGVGSTGTFVGIGSQDVNLIKINNYGTEYLHSFKTNFKSIIVGDVYKNSVKVSTEQNHGLSNGDFVNVEVVSGITTTVSIIYDDINRRLLVNPISFTGSSINLSKNTISIPNHNLASGQKVIYTSSTPSSGLVNSKIYYIVVADNNTILLSNDYYSKISSKESIQIIEIGTQSPGVISQINPEIFGIKKSTVIFDLSHPSLSSNSLPAFDFNIYTDSNFQNEFYTTDKNKGDFNIKKSGVIGEEGARLTFILDDFVPTKLYYKLSPIKYFGATLSKIQIFNDNYNIKNSNQFTIIESKFNVTAKVSGITTNTFLYTTPSIPEVLNYSKYNAIINYQTSSTTAIGPVSKIIIQSGGRGYKKLPYISEINSGLGTGVLFLPKSNKIGKVNQVTLTDIGFDYPSDLTLSPSANFPFIYKIEPLSKFERIQIINPGRNYFVTPQLVVVDGFTGRVNFETNLEYNTGDTEVTIKRNTTGLYNVTPKIIPINNPNGIKIENITYNSTTYIATVSFGSTYASSESFPFIAGEKVIIENTNIDSTFGGRGFNSAAYNYVLFPILTADADVGGENPNITINMFDFLNPDEFPGFYDNFESFGTVTPESYFPIFKIKLVKDSFRKGERVISEDGNVGIVQSYDFNNEYLKVRSKKLFKVNDLIIGSSSKNKGLISSVEGIKGKYSVGSNSITKKGWRKETGKLNQSFQRLHDNDYYQYFSYAVRSPIDSLLWNPFVSNLVHTSGFKKFGELTIESYDSSVVGMSSEQNLNSVISISDLVEIVDLNSVKDFDIAREKSIEVNNNLISNEILFNLPFLAKYQEFTGNRVLPIDDFSDKFNGVKRDFELTSNNSKIFQVNFDGTDTNKVSVGENSFNLSNHYFVTGEEIEYIPHNNNFANAIKIEPSNFGPGIGTTTLLPSKFIVIKQDNQKIRVAISATNSLLYNPIGVAITGVGIGSSHIFRSINANNRMLISINGTIQSPLVGTAYTSALSSNVGIGSTNINVVGVTSIFGGDLIKINSEVMFVSSVNENTNTINVKRGWMGSVETTHISNNIITKLSGNYDVSENKINFSEAPWGNLPIGFGTTSISSNDIDYSGLTTSSRFSGRVFLRSSLGEGLTTSYSKAYNNNYVFDDISNNFNGITTTHTLKYQGNNISDITANNSIILINDIFQGPQRLGNVLTNIAGDYKLIPNAGTLQIGFSGKSSNLALTQDINANNIPKGGIIVSVGSTSGFGYQPLVSAGGTALVSAAGTISYISIGNSGSGYRSGLQTVKVGIQTSGYNNKITYIGIATVSNGHIIGVAITNPIIFYQPKSISNIGYSSITGVTTVTTLIPHGLQLGEQVSIVGAAFTCDYYPPLGVSSAVYSNTTGIMTVTTVGLTTLNVVNFTYDNTTGLSTVITSQPHKLVPQTAIGRSFSLAGLALTCVGYGQTFAVYDFTYNKTTGISTIVTIGNHGLTAGDNFKMRDIIFDCPIGGATGYGQTFTITQLKYDNTTGLATVTTSSSFSGVIGIGSDIKLKNLEFSCPGGSGITTTIFPDGTQGSTFRVSNVLSSTIFETNVGISTISHTYVENNAGQVTAGLTTSKFPDGTQGYFFTVNTVGTTTSFTVNVGPSSIAHTYVSGGVIQVGINTDIFPGNSPIVSPLGDIFETLGAPNSYTIIFNSGISTIPHSYVSGGTLTLGHKLKIGTDVILTGLAFTCSYAGAGVGILTHPRDSDPTYCGTQVTKINNLNTFEINVGVTTAASFYTSGGIVEEIITAPRQINNSPTSQDPSANGTSVISILDDYRFIINSGPSPYTHFYKRCGKITKPLDVLFDDPLNYSDIPLIYKQGTVGFGTGAKINLNVSQNTRIINFELTNFGYGYGSQEVLTVAIGGTVGIPTFVGITTFNHFELTVDKTYQSKFSGWNVGEFIVIDDISKFFNGRRRLFRMTVNQEVISFFAKANSGVNLQSNLIVFINDVLQTPGEGYTFTGGSTLRFSEAPKGALAGFSTTGDRVKLLVYTGTQSVDVKTVEVLPSLKVGDNVQLYSDNDETFTQQQRLVLEISAADRIFTNNYGKEGVSLNELYSRPISWFKQTVDKIIGPDYIGKDRVYYEPQISPNTQIIESIGIQSTSVFVYNTRPLFDDPYEGISSEERSIIEIISNDVLISATASATIGVGGSVTNLILTNPGYGYTIAPDIIIQKPFNLGTPATASATIGAGGSITSITVGTGGTNYFYGKLGSVIVSQQGTGFPPLNVGQNIFYKAKLKTQSGIGRGASADIQLSLLTFDINSVSITNSGANYKVGDILYVDTFNNVGLGSTYRNWALGSPMKFTVTSILPPPVLIAPPKRKIETVINVNYEGDYGIIVGVATTSCSGVTTCLKMELDMFIPLNSRIRKSLNISQTGIITGHLFNVNESIFGISTQTSLRKNGSILGISSQFIDMTFECVDWYTKQKVIPPGISGLASTIGITTTIKTIVVQLLDNPPNNIVGFGTTSFYGNYSWGKINMPVRINPISFPAYHQTKQSGISSNATIRRQSTLKYLGYILE